MQRVHHGFNKFIILSSNIKENIYQSLKLISTLCKRETRATVENFTIQIAEKEISICKELLMSYSERFTNYVINYPEENSIYLNSDMSLDEIRLLIAMIKRESDNDDIQDLIEKFEVASRLNIC